MAFRNPVTSIPAAGIIGLIQGSQLAADSIDGKTITGATIRTAAAPNIRWEMDSAPADKILGYTGDPSEVAPGAFTLVPIPGASISTILRSPQTLADTYSALELRAFNAVNGYATQASLIADTVVLNGAVNLNGASVAATGQLSEGGGYNVPNVWIPSGRVATPRVFIWSGSITTDANGQWALNLSGYFTQVYSCSIVAVGIANGLSVAVINGTVTAYTLRVFNAGVAKVSSTFTAAVTFHGIY